jgi:predicted amidophosphoribosyltransferase
MPRHLEEMMFGKDTICWGCGDRFQFDENALEMDKPECLDCRSAKKAGVTKEEYLEFQSRVMDKLNGAFEYKPLLPKVMADLKPKE